MVEIRGVEYSYDEELTLSDIDITIKNGEIVCLLGPSGCGKTTLLRVIAGLQKPDRGDILINGQSIIDVPVHMRDFGLMFQDYALFPHMNVAQNVAFGLRMHRKTRIEQDKRVQEVLALVNLIGFEHRPVTELSGGEQQRVALARSLAPKPRLLMLDEPLGSLDAALREKLVLELRTIIKAFGVTSIYVTHDQHEAYSIADRIIIMNHGVIQQVGSPQDIYSRPANTFVAQFLGFENVYYKETHITTWLEPLWENCPDGTNAILVHPAGISLTETAHSLTVRGVIVNQTYYGENYRLTVKPQSGHGMTLAFKVAASSGSRLAQGETIQVFINPDFVVPLL